MVTAPAASPRLDRRRAIARLLDGRDDLLVVSGLGSPTYDVHAAGDRAGNYYLWGAMGGAAMVGLGLALARADRQVLVVTGDGEQLMGLGGLATIAAARPRNLTLAIVDNGHFGETGMQVSHTALGVDLAAVAAACGFAHTATAGDDAGLERVCANLSEAPDGPRLFVLKVRPESHERSMPPRDAVHIKNRFRAHLGLPVT